MSRRAANALAKPSFAPPDALSLRVAAAYFRLAWQYTQSRQGRLILVNGVSGSGKSTVGSALAQKAGAISRSYRADLVVLNGGDAALAQQGVDNILDAAIFGPCRQPVRDVMSGGAWIVRDGHHAREAEIFARYRAALRSLGH